MQCSLNRETVNREVQRRLHKGAHDYLHLHHKTERADSSGSAALHRASNRVVGSNPVW
jgi:hypothetical protein